MERRLLKQNTSRNRSASKRKGRPRTARTPATTTTTAVPRQTATPATTTTTTAVPRQTATPATTTTTTAVPSQTAAPVNTPARDTASVTIPVAENTAASAPTASQKKLDYNNFTEVPTRGHNQNFTTTVVHLEMLAGLFSNVVCGKCQAPVSLQQDDVASRGFAVCLRVMCVTCGIISSTYTSRMNHNVPEVNRAMVASTVSVGLGHTTLSKVCEVLGMSSLTLKTHQKLVKGVHSSSMRTLTNCLNRARDIVKQVHEPDDDGYFNIPVSFDGTWHKRGHTSNHGAAAVICAVTGLVIDAHVMSLHCQNCKVLERRFKDDPAALEREKTAHVPFCQKNYEGTSGGMEVEAAKVMWARSEDYRLRYTTMVSDGDTKTFNALLTLKPYGPTVAISKAECVNHVAKRLNTALRKVVDDEKKRGVTLGGRGEGQLTQEKIGKFQAYYTKAIRGSAGKGVDEAKNAVMASYYHSTSSDEWPKHMLCPKGVDSWCFYQRSVAQNLPIPSHTEYLSTYINTNVAKYVLPVYRRLSGADLLEGCQLGKTQNANESFHSTLWLRSPKHVFVGRRRIEIALVFAVLEWNKGSVGTHAFMSDLNLSITANTIELGKRRDSARLKGAKKMEESGKKARLEKKQSAIRLENQRRAADIDKYGGPSYEPGAGAIGRSP